MTAELRLVMIDTARRMNRAGINRGTSGNLSARLGAGLLITPSGLDYASMQPDDIVYMDLDGKPQGARRPSSEWRIHRDIYRQREDALAILHAHPVFCSALACLGKAIPPFHYMVAVAGGANIRCSEYATFGTQELSDQVLSALRDRKACLMGNHGLVCIERNPERALALAIEVEQLAQVYLQCLAVGEPPILDDEEMARVVEKFKSYGAG